jgi:putative acetyltransferase
MLFVDPVARGKGIGKLLMQYAIEEHKISKVDVNEQNEQAV